MNKDKKQLALEYYGEVYNEECGKWNTSLVCKWIDYEETKFFEEHFKIDSAKNLLNIGIGPGVWDRYLSYKMNKDSKLTSIDIDPDITDTFIACLENEGNKRNIEILNINFFDYKPSNKFDIITLVGSAVLEIGDYQKLFLKALSHLSKNGELYYMTVEDSESKDNLLNVLNDTQYKLELFEQLSKYKVQITFAKIINE